MPEDEHVTSLIHVDPSYLLLHPFLERIKKGEPVTRTSPKELPAFEAKMKMAASTFATWFVATVNNSVGTAVSIGTKLTVRYYAKGSTRTMMSVATVICREGIKLRVNAWASKKWKRKRTELGNRMKLSLTNTFKWPKMKRTRNSATTSEADLNHGNEVVAISAALKYQALAEKRLEAAWISYEAAAIEFREAERELDDAKNYVRTVKSYCNNKSPHIGRERSKSSSDIVFVDYPD